MMQKSLKIDENKKASFDIKGTEWVKYVQDKIMLQFIVRWSKRYDL